MKLLGHFLFQENFEQPWQLQKYFCNFFYAGLRVEKQLLYVFFLNSKTDKEILIYSFVYKAQPSIYGLFLKCCCYPYFLFKPESLIACLGRP